MKLTTLILIISLMQVSAASFGQRLTLIGNNVKLERVFNEIQKQTGYGVLVSTSKVDTDKSVKVNFRNTALTDVMDQLTRGSDLAYTIEDKVIVIKEKETSILDRVIARFQAIDVRGKVVDSLGNGLPGATVSVKNGKGSTSTDAGGNFQLKNVDEGAVLLVSYLGYVTREVAVVDEFLTIKLRQSESKLDEVKVIAYGTTTQRLSTGNTQGIKSTEIEKQPVNNPLLALQGRIAGLQITPSTGLPGGPVDVNIRGKNTLNFGVNSANPLVVVNGLPIANEIEGLGYGPNLQRLSAISFINPNEIESIDVLKDADATSIYGSRGANGVILITTKKGKVGDARIDVNIQNGYGEVVKKIDLLNTQEYLALRKEAYSNSGVNLANSTVNASRADVKMWDQNRSTDWQEELLGKTAAYQNIQVSISGGSSAVQYSLGGNYNRETTVFPGESMDKRGSAYMNLSGSSKDGRFKATATTNFLFNKNTLPGIDFTEQARRLAPNAPNLYATDGSLNWEPLPSGAKSWDNPMAQLARTYDATINNLIASTDITYNPLRSLVLRAQLSYNLLNGNAFRKTYPFSDRSPTELSQPANSNFNTNGSKNFSFEPQIGYLLKIGKSALTFLGGASIQNTYSENQSITAEGFTSDALLKNLQAAENYFILNSSAQYRYNAVFGRINYNWEDKYIMNFSVRRDGSSRFGPGRQFGNFGSIGAAWIFSQENFIKTLIPFVSYGKFRFSYGSSGNDGIQDYGYLERYEPIQGAETYQGLRGYRSAGLYNPYYAWETTRKLEAGLETGFWQDRLLSTISYFRNRSGNQLLNIPFASTAGPGAPLYNFDALIQNAGLEITLQTQNLKGRNVSWSTSFNFSRDRNKLLDFPNLESSPYYSVFEVGQPFYGVSRVFNFSGVDPETGRYQFTDINGKVTLEPEDKSRLDGGKYLRIMTIPRFYGGISNTVTFRKFSLDIFIQYTKQLGINPVLSTAGIAGSPSNLPKEYSERWQKPGDVANIQKVFSTLSGDYSRSANYAMASDQNYVDASFIRLKNFSLSYSLPAVWIEKIGAKKIRIFTQGQNVLTFTNYKGLDPETQSLGTIPPLRILTFGLNVSL